MTTKRRLWLVPLVVGAAAAGAWLSAGRRGAEAPAVEIVRGKPSLLVFGMGVCEQCKKMKPVAERASRELGERLQVHVLDIRVDANERLAERYHLQVIPLTVLADGEGVELWRHEGFVGYAELSTAIAERLGER